MDVFLTGFPKKLLVAVSVVVLVTMCVMPVETRSVEHKKRHKRLESMAQTKDTVTFLPVHRRRHNRRSENLILPTKENMRQPKNSRADMFNRKKTNIIKKLRHTSRLLKDDKRKLFGNDMKEFRQATPSWVPVVNFIEIHYHNYRKPNGNISMELKFKYQIPKLYKSLVEYKEIFKRLRDVELAFPDDANNSNKIKRNKIIQDTINNLNSTIEEVKDCMEEVGLNYKTLSHNNKLDLTTLERKVDATQCLKNDYLAFRGYWNVINNWHLELRCPRRGVTKKPCRDFEEKMKIKRDALIKRRSSKTDKNVT